MERPTTSNNAGGGQGGRGDGYGGGNSSGNKKGLSGMDLKTLEDKKRKFIETIDREIELKKSKVNSPFEVPEKLENETYAEYGKKVLDSASEFPQLCKAVEKISELIKPLASYLVEFDHILPVVTSENLTYMRCCKFFAYGSCKNTNIMHYESKQKKDKIAGHFCMICKEVLKAPANHPTVSCTLLAAIDAKPEYCKPPEAEEDLTATTTSTTTSSTTTTSTTTARPSGSLIPPPPPNPPTRDPPIPPTPRNSNSRKKSAKTKPVRHTENP